MKPPTKEQIEALANTLELDDDDKADIGNRVADFRAMLVWSAKKREARRRLVDQRKGAPARAAILQHDVMVSLAKRYLDGETLASINNSLGLGRYSYAVSHRFYEWSSKTLGDEYWTMKPKEALQKLKELGWPNNLHPAATGSDSATP